ncbi:unnamed protein product, partial [Ascophyllum nodosum]
EDDDAPFYPRPTDGQSPEAPLRENKVVLLRELARRRSNKCSACASARC